VDGVGQQGHRSGDGEDGDLEKRRGAEPAETHTQGPETFPGGGGRVDQLGVVMVVRGDELADGIEQPGAVLVVLVEVPIDLVAVSGVIVVMSHGHGLRGL
jgi:hypothetical protein